MGIGIIIIIIMIIIIIIIIVIIMMTTMMMILLLLLLILITIMVDIYIAPIQICSRRFTKVTELKRKFYEINTQSTMIKWHGDNRSVDN